MQLTICRDLPRCRLHDIVDRSDAIRELGELPTCLTSTYFAFYLHLALNTTMAATTTTDSPVASKKGLSASAASARAQLD